MQKLKIWKLGVDEAALENNWDGLHKDRVKKLLSLDFMSSESSGKESDDGSAISCSVLKVKRITWLKKKYRNSLHQIDTVYYKSHKSRDKLKRRVPGGDSTRTVPNDAHKYAVKS